MVMIMHVEALMKLAQFLNDRYVALYKSWKHFLQTKGSKELFTCMLEHALWKIQHMSVLYPVSTFIFFLNQPEEKD